MRHNIIHKSQLLWYEIARWIKKTKFIAEIDVTWRCQLNCTHCYYQKYTGTEEQSQVAWKKFFDELYDRGVRYVLLVGGEPTLRMEIINMAVERFKFVDVITNGLIKIPTSLSVRIFLSVDGLEHTNDKIRGEGVFRKAIGNYANDRRVIINMTLLPENFRELEQVVCVSKNNNFQGVACNVITPVKLSETTSDPLSPMERQSIIDEMYRVKEKYPHQLLLTNNMIRWYAHPDHRDNCYWREHALHYDFLFHRKSCFTDLDCRFCGCYSGASLTTKVPFQNKTKQFKKAKH